MFGRYRSSYGQQRIEGSFKKASSTTTERGDPPAQHRDGRQAEGNPSEQKKVTYPQAGSLEAQAEISTCTELKISSKQQNYEDDQWVVREHRSGHCSTETSKSKVTPSVDIERRAQEKGNLEQKLDSPAEEELVEIASLVCKPWSPSPCDASGQAASNSSSNFLEVIKMKLEFSQKQFEFKEKLAHERTMRETELKWNLDHQRALEKLQEKEAELQRLQQKNNRDTDGLEEAGNTELKEPEIQGKEFSCTGSLMRRLELSNMPLLFGGIAEKSTAEKNPEERSYQPVKNKIHDLIIELKSLEEDNNPETLAFVEILSNHVRLHKKMIRSLKVSQKADLPKETKTATVDPVPKAEDASKQPDIDKKQGHKADTKPFASLPAPVPVSPYSTPPITSTPPLIIIFPIQVLVAGQAFGSDQQFLNQIEKHLEPSNIFLQKEPFTPSSDGLLLLFCPVVSRAGTDIINALEKSPAQAKIILVVMNHVPNESMTVYLDSRSKVHRQSVIHSVDCRFSERSGLYPSQMNNDAVISVARKIQAEAKARS